MSQYGIPYMGSKSKIAASIAMNFPVADNFYDLFGGGFSISHYMLENKAHRYKSFQYNEIKSDIVDLVKRAINGEFNYDRYKPEWISKEKFFEVKDTDAKVRCLWSFGNNQRGYLFGEDIEPYKKSMHMAVVFDEFDSLAEEVFGFTKWPAIANTITKRRSYLGQKIEFFSKTKIPIVLHKFIKELRVNSSHKSLEQLKQLQQLQQLEALERLQQLERVEGLHFYSDDYRNIIIKPNSVVYCDIPYEGTGDKGEGGYLLKFNHKEFFDWAASRDFPVFISEYSVEDSRFKLVYSVDKRSLLSGKKANDIKSENLYWNGASI